MTLHYLPAPIDSPNDAPDTQEHIHCCTFLDGFIHIIRDTTESGKLFFIIEFFEGVCYGHVELQEYHGQKSVMGIITLNIEAIMKDIEIKYLEFIVSLRHKVAYDNPKFYIQ